MKTYKIIGTTNPYIAQRDSTFKGKTTIILESGLSLKDAQKRLLEFFNEQYETYYHNWGLVVANSGVAYSCQDGTRGYEYDSRNYSIEEDDLYRVDDIESGNYVIYEGVDLQEAIDSIIFDDEPEAWDLYKNGERIWCGKIDTINELNRLRIGVMENRIRIGSRLRELREAQGLTTTQMGERCGLSHSTISKVENGKWSVSIDILSKICEALGKRVDII